MNKLLDGETPEVAMFDIATLSYTDAAAPAEFARSLHETGFAVLRDHPIGPERIASIYEAWGRFFNSDAKHDWLADPSRQDGYFPFKSENAKGSQGQGPEGVLPRLSQGPGSGSELEAETRALYMTIWSVPSGPPCWAGSRSTRPRRGDRAHFSETLSADAGRLGPRTCCASCTIRRWTTAPEPGAVRAAAHGDINLITCLLAGSEPGLEAKDTQGRWHRVPCDPGMMAINAGDMLDMATGGYYPATVHRVVNPPAERNVARFSMPMFLHPRPEVVLKPGTTADDFLTERLREIGLKS